MKRLKFGTIEVIHVRVDFHGFAKETEGTFPKQRCFEVLAPVVMLRIFAQMLEILPQPLYRFIILPELDIALCDMLPDSQCVVWRCMVNCSFRLSVLQ